jgi:hypothetical protein
MCLAVKLLILTDVCNTLPLDFRFPIYRVHCRHFESAFYEEVKLYPSCKKMEGLDVMMCELDVDKVSFILFISMH